MHPVGLAEYTEVLLHCQDKLPQALDIGDILNAVYLYCFTMNKKNPNLFSNYETINFLFESLLDV